MDPDQLTPEFIEIGNWAMLVERGLEPAVAMRAAKQYTAKCADNEKLRADLASIRSVYDFAALEARIAELRAALKPFADEAESMIKNEEWWPEDKPLYSDGKVTIADYRRAAQALEQKVDSNG